MSGKPLPRQAPWVAGPLLAAVLGMALGAGCCPTPPGLQVGATWIDGRELDEAVELLRRTFPSYGTDTLRWSLLDYGLGARAILHERFPRESRAARQEAERWAQRLRTGASFPDLLTEFPGGDEDELDRNQPLPPHPAGLGAAVAAAISPLEEGEWVGPVRTRIGWEIVYVHRRFAGDRSRSNVVVWRIRFHVGSEEDAARARQDWDRLPLSGDPEYLRAVPAENRRRRAQQED